MACIFDNDKQIKITIKTFTIMKFGINNPSFLQSAGNAGSANDYFYITSRAAGNQLSFATGLLGVFAENVEYGVNSTEDWVQLTRDTTITLNEQDTVYFRNHTGVVNNNGGTVLLEITEQFDAGGNIMKLFYPGQSAVPANGFDHLFAELPIVSAGELKLTAKKIGVSAYEYMFNSCDSLTTAPELPATVLADNCYSSMFGFCTSLTTAPELPATVLAGYCYCDMFNSCTSLTTAPKLPATVLADGCYSDMFVNCTNLTSAPELPATVLAAYCYIRMFNSCDSLTTAPELPAMVLADSCYCEMFNRCTNLTTAPELPATALAESCYNAMFTNCTSLTTAPKLPATLLADYCYESMFSGCSSMNKVTCLAIDTSAVDYTTDWLDGVADSGVFIKNSDMNNWPTGSSGIPEGWTVQDYAG